MAFDAQIMDECAMSLGSLADKGVEKKKRKK